MMHSESVTTLYRQNANGIGFWKIWAENGGLVIEHATVMGGSPVRHTEAVDCGKQSRTIDQQIASRIASRISRMRDKGYKDTIELARAGSNSNQLGFDRPMLAQPYEKVTNIDWCEAVQQKKLNGHRCLITRQSDEIIPYSRLGKQIPTIKHIINALYDRLPEGVTIDGELYTYGVPLQTISSWVKADQPNTLRVNFVCYDIISKENYVDRHEELSSMLKGIQTGCEGRVLVLPYEPVTDLEHAMKTRDRYIKFGFEGGMVRLHGRGYEVGKRSSSLIKIKKFQDTEFKVLDIVPSEKGWGICICEVVPGKTFKTSAPGTIEEKTEVLINKNKYIGRMLTVEYAELTNDGLPFHCSATGWREDL